MDGALRDVEDAGGKKPVPAKKVHDLESQRTPGGRAAVTSLAHTMAAVHAGVCSTPSARDPGGSCRVMGFHLHVGLTAAVKLFVDPKR